MDVIFQAFGLVATWNVVLTVLAASIFGLFVGAVPGLTATMATAMLVPLTFFMEPVAAVGAMVACSAMAIFAGDIPEGSLVKLIKANTDRLIAGAVAAADNSINPGSTRNPDLAILISCVGRKLVLKQLVEEEVEGVQSVFGKDTLLTGFYSYGEISPFSSEARCELHNQTMTVTTFTEY